MCALKFGAIFFECTLDQVTKHGVFVSLLIFGVNLFCQFLTGINIISQYNFRFAYFSFCQF